ncbi:jg19295 [Pararge aegeria aegeria]|uniref:Jg19295 protein n=1 Tax=Pararge aegeria aegeria TaxID=348720 RepID=A0A8S4RP95_9NEOP|nr:jg19295 [Pararge aegeria aegeria]
MTAGHLIRARPTLRFGNRNQCGAAIPAPWDPNVHPFSELCAPPVATSASRLVELCNICYSKSLPQNDAVVASASDLVESMFITTDREILS